MDEVVALSGGEKRMMKETEEDDQSKNKKHQKQDDDSGGSDEVVWWENFLPRMVLRVLLVEADQSTRQIIAAILRKCSYRVAAVPDGLMAWEILKRKAPDIDLILTEVELPSISGFALLTLIMEHDIGKNIPVIMMSSHDSVSMVLKCMLKGAADFLIKPVRRNELRNLWQHIWRRHAIFRPPQNLTFLERKLEAGLENIAASNQSSGSLASTQKNNECSEKGASQLKSFSNLSNIDMVKHKDATKSEMESAKHNNETAEKSITLVSEVARCNKTSESAGLRLEQGHGCAETENQEGVLQVELSRANPYLCSNELTEPSTGAIDLIATFENLPKQSDKNCSLNCGNATKFGFDTQLELSLRKDFPGSSCKQETGERQILNHSNASAFSWYSGSKLLQPLFPTPLSCSAKVNDTNWDSIESHKLSGDTVDACQYGGTNQNQDNMTTLVIGQSGQIGLKLPKSQCGHFPVPWVTSDHKSKRHDNVFPSVFYAQSGVCPIWTPKPVCRNESSPFPTSTSSQSNSDGHYSEHHHWAEDATYSSLDQNVHSSLDHARDESSAAGQSAGPAGNNVCRDVANHINSSAYERMASRTDGNAISAVVANNNPESFGDSDCLNYDGFRRVDAHRSSQREAALTKFRLKRKDRCYGKKVRYQSRKRLAEQRPRVKGQFVRQVHNDHPTDHADSGS